MDSKETESNLPDHDDKYNITEDALEEANKKMVAMSAKGFTTKAIDAETDAEIVKPKTVKVGGKVLHVRTSEDYENIWGSFKANSAEEFEEYMGYSVDDILRIGKEKFIDAFDWVTPLDVFSFRTDVIHILPCCHCGKEFASVEDDYGLCEGCLPLYDMDFFEQVVSETDNAVREEISKLLPGTNRFPATKTQGMALFLYDANFRNLFLKTELDKRKGYKDNV